MTLCLFETNTHGQGNAIPISFLALKFILWEFYLYLIKLLHKHFSIDVEILLRRERRSEFYIDKAL